MLLHEMQTAMGSCRLAIAGRALVPPLRQFPKVMEALHSRHSRVKGLLSCDLFSSNISEWLIGQPYRTISSAKRVGENPEGMRIAFELSIASRVGTMEPTSLDRPGATETDHRLILYVGDDTSVSDPILERLLGIGCQVRVVETVTAAWRSIVQASPFAVVIDATQMNARWRPWELCRELSECKRFPVVMIFPDGEASAKDHGKAMEHGADRCFALGRHLSDELAAYMEMQPVRPVSTPLAHQPQAPGEMRMTIDWETRQVIRRERVISLSPKQFALLQLLRKHSGHVVSEREIIRALWRTSVCPATRENLKQVVKHLRSKIEEDSAHPQYLVNVRGLGYCLKADLMNGSGAHDI